MFVYLLKACAPQSGCSALRLNPDIEKYWERFNSNQLVANVNLEFKVNSLSELIFQSTLHVQNTGGFFNHKQSARLKDYFNKEFTRTQKIDYTVFLLLFFVPSPS